MAVKTLEPVLIGGFRKGKPKDSNQPDGDRYADSVQYIEEGEYGGVRVVELHASINGDRPAVGTKQYVHLDYFPRRCKRARRDGTLYDTTLFDPVVVGFSKAA